MDAQANAAPAPPHLPLLGDLIRFVASSPSVATSQRPYLLWALKRTLALLGRGASDIPADPQLVLRLVDRHSPAMAGLKPQSFANLKSRLRQAFRLAAPHLAPARSRIRLGGLWASLNASLGVRDSRHLSRFLRFTQANGWQPTEVRDQHLRAFEAYLRDEVMLDKAAKVVRRTARAWNRAADSAPGWPQQYLAVPPPKRTRYWVNQQDLPDSLQAEIATLLKRLGDPTPFLDGPSVRLAPATIDQYRITFIQLASALAASGTALGDLGSLQSLVSPTPLRVALTYLYNRAGGRVSHQVEILAYRAQKVARQLGQLTEREIEELGQICTMVGRDAPRKGCLTDKNRRLVEQMDDRGFVDRLVILPERLMQEAARMRNPRLAACCARDAVAIELLLTCSMRLANLIDLRLGDTIQKYGQGRDARWVIDIPAEKVKNGQPLRFTLPLETERLIERYLAEWHPRWTGSGSPWLFPGERRERTASTQLADSIADRTRRSLGVRITPHQFRHLMAELYLRDDPNGLGIVSQHLAHKDLNTTRGYYAREQTRVATKRYHEVLTQSRKAAVAHLGQRSKARRERSDQ